MLPQLPLLNQDFKPTITLTIKLKQEPTEKLYTIKPNDSLTKIAEETQTTVERLWEKNTDLTNPDLIEPGKSLKIPTEEETLQDRPMPVKIEPEPLSTRMSYGGARATADAGAFSVSGGNSSGNTYSPGYCTYYAKQQRPDLPNNLGNADTWFSRAAAQGYAVSYTPQVGAVAAAIGYMHVAIVTGVHGNKVTVTEMNYKGRWVVSSREAPASEFRYIL